MKNLNSEQGGYIALVSAVIISAVLTTVVFALSFSGFMARANISDTEFKKQSFNLAEACANSAILKKIQDSTYAGNETLTISGLDCFVRPISACTSNCIIETQAVIHRATTNVRITLDSATFQIVDWEELADF